MLAQLHAQYRTLSLQQPFQIETTWTAETPHDLSGLQQQTEYLKQQLKRRTQSPPTPTVQALNQLVKGCELAMQSAVLLANENTKLHAENAHQKRKRAQKRSYIAKGGVFTGAEAQSLLENEQNSDVEVVESEVRETRKRALPKCSLCGSLEHKAPKCPRR